MSKRVIIDPITRIEGHLRIEVEVDDNNVIKNAYSSATLFRGLEVIAKGRDPRDVPFLMQRICGVCTYSHYLKSTMAVENALGIVPPLNAQLTRALMNMALFLHDHTVHFYQLHGLDWIDIVSALKADPKKASELSFKYTENPIGTGENDLKEVQNKLKAFAANPQGLGPFANAYWGHPTYKLTPEQNLIATSHYLKALEIQRKAAQLLAIFGAKQPHPQSLTVGGVTCIMDLMDPSRMAEYLTKFQEIANFVNNAYYADIIMVAQSYANEPSVINPNIVKNYMCHKDIMLDNNQFLFESGYILDGDLSKIFDINENLITEEATHSWYKNNEPLHPYDGKTEAEYTGYVDMQSVGPDGKMIATKNVDKASKYSWIKSPRYDGKAMEVGPLACVTINYLKNNKPFVKTVDEFLAAANLKKEMLFTTLGRTAARCIQARVIANYGLQSFYSLINNLKVDQTTCTPYVIDKNKEYKGVGFGDVPRGMLSHWIRIKNGVVENYQAVVPSTWNAGPIDSKNTKGSYESNLVGIKLANLTQPLEVIRNIHSYDPCIACAVHVMDTKGNKLAEYRVDPSYMKTFNADEK